MRFEGVFELWGVWSAPSAQVALGGWWGLMVVTGMGAAYVWVAVWLIGRWWRSSGTKVVSGPRVKITTACQSVSRSGLGWGR